MISGKVKATIRLINELVYPSYTRKLAGSMKPISVTLPVTMLPNESKEIILSPQKFSVLSIQNPYLWYPNGYGEQYMHSLDLSFDMNNGKSSDREKVNFGIREVTSELMKTGKNMVVYSLSMANASSVKGDGYNRMYFSTTHPNEFMTRHD